MVTLSSDNLVLLHTRTTSNDAHFVTLPSRDRDVCRKRVYTDVTDWSIHRYRGTSFYSASDLMMWSAPHRAPALCPVVRPTQRTCTGCTQARFPFKRNRLRFLRFSFTQRTQSTQRKRLRLNGNRASYSSSNSSWWWWWWCYINNVTFIGFGGQEGWVYNKHSDMRKK